MATKEELDAALANLTGMVAPAPVAAPANPVQMVSPLSTPERLVWGAVRGEENQYKALQKMGFGQDQILKPSDPRNIVKDWAVVNPETGQIHPVDPKGGFKDIAGDIAESVPKVLTGVLSGTGTVVGGTVGSALGPVGTVGGAVAGGAGGAALGEAGTQGLAKLLGYQDKMDIGEIGREALAGGVTSLIPGSGTAIARVGKGLIKGEGATAIAKAGQEYLAKMAGKIPAGVSGGAAKQWFTGKIAPKQVEAMKTTLIKQGLSPEIAEQRVAEILSKDYQKVSKALPSFGILPGGDVAKEAILKGGVQDLGKGVSKEAPELMAQAGARVKQAVEEAIPAINKTFENELNQEVARMNVQGAKLANADAISIALRGLDNKTPLFDTSLTDAISTAREMLTKQARYGNVSSATVKAIGQIEKLAAGKSTTYGEIKIATKALYKDIIPKLEKAEEGALEGAMRKVGAILTEAKNQNPVIAKLNAKYGGAAEGSELLHNIFRLGTERGKLNIDKAINNLTKEMGNVTKRSQLEAFDKFLQSTPETAHLSFMPAVNKANVVQAMTQEKGGKIIPSEMTRFAPIAMLSKLASGLTGGAEGKYRLANALVKHGILKPESAEAYIRKGTLAPIRALVESLGLKVPGVSIEGLEKQGLMYGVRKALKPADKQKEIQMERNKPKVNPNGSTNIQALSKILQERGLTT